MTTSTSGTAVTGEAPSGLTFPAAIFRKIAPETYLLRHLQQAPPTRPSTRSPTTFRDPSLHTESLSHTHGSAVFRIGDTAVVAGVRGEILSLTHGEGRARQRMVEVRVEGEGGVVEEKQEEDVDDTPIEEWNLLVPNIELGTGCTHNHHPGPPSDFAQATAARLYSLLVSTTPSIIPASTLRIKDEEGETKAFWVLYIDVVCISLDGSAFDATWAAIIAALKATRLPVTRWDAEEERVVCERNQTRALAMRGRVWSASFGVVEEPESQDDDEDDEDENMEEKERRKWILSDLDEFEEEVCREKVTVCVDEKGEVVRIEKGGGTVAGVEEVLECVRRARERAAVLDKLVGGDGRA